ncbi:hypothetical protein P879_10329 [Paragonimus westermani]|uniref:Vacuolar protein-sorting-associated protein 25 n=1 Tax=Paragonimus westermani TaxID=34504 RepID=A0A8T0DCW3_9TREM|nr:hypothetical protein P879_10329 [Paragonimus westermani]
MSSQKFEWPWLYNFPPFFTLQPNAETRRKQQDAWCQLVLDYFRHKNVYNISIASIRDSSCSLFHNKSISRSANSDLISNVLDELHRRGNLEWIDKQRINARIIWRTPEEWADILFRWARDTGHDTESEPFHGLDNTILLEALRCLQKRGKAELISDEVAASVNISQSRPCNCGGLRRVVLFYLVL